MLKGHSAGNFVAAIGRMKELPLGFSSRHFYRPFQVRTAQLRFGPPAPFTAGKGREGLGAVILPGKTS
jgi:hypothetical protein